MDLDASSAPGPAVPGAEAPPIVELVDIHKSFGGVRAVRGVSMTIRAGEVLGLVGENGAGKSTLVKMLTGVLEPDRGHVLVDGRRQRIANPRTAREFGIAATYQEPVVFPDLDVAENVFAGRQPTQRGMVDWAGSMRGRRRPSTSSASSSTRIGPSTNWASPTAS